MELVILTDFFVVFVSCISDFLQVPFQVTVIVRIQINSRRLWLASQLARMRDTRNA